METAKFAEEGKAVRRLILRNISSEVTETDLHDFLEALVPGLQIFIESIIIKKTENSAFVLFTQSSATKNAYEVLQGAKNLYLKGLNVTVMPPFIKKVPVNFSSIFFYILY